MSKEDLYHRGSGVAVSVNLAVVYRQIDQLTPDPANPRRHSKKQIRQIADSIRELGITEVPTLCLDHLTPALPGSRSGERAGTGDDADFDHGRRSPDRGRVNGR